MLYFLITRLATNELAAMAVIMMKTDWKPFTYDSRMAVFSAEAAMVRRTKIQRSESCAMVVVTPRSDSLSDIAFWKTVPDS